MAYTAPTTRTTGTLITASIWNTDITDNLTAIWVGTTAGDTDYYTSSTAKTRVQIGTTGQVYKVNAAGNAPSWGGNALYRSTTAVTIGTTETTIMSGTVPANTLGTVGAVHVFAMGTLSPNASAQQITVSATYGTTSVLSFTTAQHNNYSGTMTWDLSLVLLANGSTNGQVCVGRYYACGTETTSSYNVAMGGLGTAGEDSTAAKVLTIKMTRSASMAAVYKAGWYTIQG